MMSDTCPLCCRTYAVRAVWRGGERRKEILLLSDMAQASLLTRSWHNPTSPWRKREGAPPPRREQQEHDLPCSTDCRSPTRTCPAKEVLSPMGEERQARCGRCDVPDPLPGGDCPDAHADRCGATPALVVWLGGVSDAHEGRRHGAGLGRRVGHKETARARSTLRRYPHAAKDASQP